MTEEKKKEYAYCAVRKNPKQIKSAVFLAVKSKKKIEENTEIFVIIMVCVLIAGKISFLDKKEDAQNVLLEFTKATLKAETKAKNMLQNITKKIF